MSVSETTETERKQTERITYIYQLDKDAWEQWLKWSKEEREVGTTTLKNLRRWASMFGVWLTERGYMSENPLTDVKVEVDRKTQREENEAGKKKYISKDDRKRIWAWLDEHDKPMLLASYLCYYCMIRPKEMMQLRVYMVSVKNSLLSVPKEISKTHHDDVVTIPDVVMKLMIDMGVLNHDGEWLLFDKDLLPAPAHTHINNGEALRDRWAVMKKALRLPNSMWFYHLKHTGITDLAMVLPPRQVQLQARHHSLEMTERYMQPAQPVANEDIKKYV